MGTEAPLPRGHLPNEAAVGSLASALLLHLHDQVRSAQRRYFSETMWARLNIERENVTGRSPS